MKISDELKVGILATIAIVMLVLGYNLMRGKDFLNKDRTFYAIFDRVDGLALASHVRYQGLNVGRVQDMRLLPDGSNRIRVSMSVTSDLNVPQASVARIVQTDLFGTKAIQIELSDREELARSGDTLIAAYEGDVINEVKVRAESIFASLDSLVKVMNTTFDKETRDQLRQSIASIQHTLAIIDQSLYENTGRIDRIFTNIDSITTTIQSHGGAIRTVITNFAAVSDSLQQAQITQTLRKANESLHRVNEVLDKINKGSGSLGLLVHDPGLYQSLDSSARALGMLVQDLQKNPGRYVQFSVFGKKEKSAKDGKK